MKRRTRAQPGQALVEFLIATMLATSVLLLGIVMLGKFNDIRNRTLTGSRYAAWERTVWIDAETSGSATRDWYARYGSDALQVQKSDRQIQRELLARVMAGNGAARLPQPVMWKDPSGTALLDDARDLTVSTHESDLSTPLDAYTSSGFGSTPTAAGGAPFAARFELPSRAFRSATLRMATGVHSDALRRLWKGFDGFAVDDTNALLTNTWLPEGTPRAEALFAQAVPAAGAQLIPPPLYEKLRVYAPEIDTLEFGRIRADVVPADRLAR
ncbi:hypothetical protein PPMP20_16190 [Paraburkholderia phymatum]|uniref:hypothetical protein n=1 Tax=Paraburkholderia phymatum TaxID=148447 RepID=UPI001FC9AB75|nr:hypothetical protein [Paraburkholderia phymatum]